jgi:hypothetical protein
MAIFGYARVSTRDQDVAAQVAEQWRVGEIVHASRVSRSAVIWLCKRAHFG